MHESVPEMSETYRRHAAIHARAVHPSGTFIPFPREAVEQSIAERFEQQVCLYPDRLAVKTRREALTYAALNALANRTAHALLTAREERQEPTALLLGKDPALIAAMLGTLKAGKITVLLDPSFPRQRLTAMLEDSQSRLLLTDNAHRAMAMELVGERLPVINVDALDARLSRESPGLSIPPDALAQIAYTSGSTGTPKGVVADQRRLLHTVLRRTKEFHICAQDRMLLHAVNANSFFKTLLNGAASYLVDTGRDGIASLARWMIEEEITAYITLASGFRSLVATLTGAERFPHLRLIRLGAEPVLRTDVELYQRHFPDHCVLFNGLGTLETGCFRHYFMDKHTEIEGAVAPAGFAAEEREVLLLDEEGQPVGDGEIGEIAVKGRYMAEGYWRKPELTQERFRPAPVGSDTRIYLTGDLGRMLPGGCLLHLGRRDFQVQIRGNRVEIAEIEAALLALDTVEQAVVIDREDVPGERRLVAYFVPRGRHAPTVTALRRALTTKLPGYMVPSAFVKMEALPVTGIGKIDRRGLPAPGGERPDLETPYVAPRTPVEEVVAELWEPLLGIEQVGIYDSFLELGGDSLMAMRLMAQMQQTFQVEVPLPVFLEAPTVAGLVETLLRYEATPGRAAAVARLRRQIEGMSVEEIEARLAANRGAGAA